MENTYVLEKAALRPSNVKVRRICRVAVNIACRTVIAIGFIGMLIVPGGIEQGTFGFGGFILLEFLMMALVAGGILGEIATHVDLPLDGGEEDE